MDQRLPGLRALLPAAVCLALSLVAAAPAFSRQVEDALGRPVELPERIRRVVALSRDGLELVRALDAISLVVGVSDTVQRDPEFWPELKDVPVVGRWMEPDYEAIARLKPDLVLAQARYPGPEAEGKLAVAGVALLRLEVYMPSAFDREARTLGRVFDKEERAGELIAWRRDKLAAVERCLGKTDERPLAYIEGYSKLQTWGPGSAGNEALALAKARNMAQSLGASYGEINGEWVLSGQPWAVVKVCSLKERYQARDASALRHAREEIAGRPGWKALEAVKAGRIFVYSSDIHAGPRAPVSVAYLARWLHPGLCQDIDPEAWHREYLERFQHVPYRGSYAWPAFGPEAGR